MPGVLGPFFADDDLEALGEVPPLRVVMELDDDVYAALDAAATGRGTTVESLAAAVEPNMNRHHQQEIGI